MISAIFHTVLFLPLYNGLIWLSAVVPGGDLGLAIILLTLAVKIVLFPLQHRMSQTQLALKQLEPKLKEVKDKHADDKSEQAKQIMALYREHGVNPFSGFLVLLIQIPILLALYWVFRSGVELKPELLYSFITPPPVLNHLFLGLFDIAAKNYWLPFLVGISQFFQMKLMTPATTGAKQSDLARSLNLQMRYMMPAMVVVIGFSLPAAISLYWLTSNLFAIGHELFVQRKATAILAK